MKHHRICWGNFITKTKHSCWNEPFFLSMCWRDKSYWSFSWKCDVVMSYSDWLIPTKGVL
jgi:hypothetical protein